MTDIEFRAAIRGLKPNQIDALNACGCDCPTSVHPKTFEALERRGLIVGEDAVLPGRFPVKFRRYSMPTAVHIAWCRWASERQGNDR